MKKYSWILALLAALTLAFAFTACGGDDPDDGEEGGVETVVIDLAEILKDAPAGEIADEAAFYAIFDKELMAAVGFDATNNAVKYEIIDDGGVKKLKFTVTKDWSGLDINIGALRTGDVISIKGVNAGVETQVLLNLNHSAWDPLQGWNPKVATDAEYEKEFEPLTSAEMGKVNSANPKAIRIRTNSATASIIIEKLTVTGKRGGKEVKLDAPAITLTADGIEWAEVEGAGGYKVFADAGTTPIAQPAATATSINLNTLAALSAGTYEITLVASGLPGTSTDSDPSNAVTFTKVASALTSFPIVIDGATGATTSVLYTAVTTNSAIITPVADGYIITQNGATYNGSWSKFSINLGNKTLSDFTEVQITFEGLEADFTNKRIYLLAGTDLSFTNWAEGKVTRDSTSSDRQPETQYWNMSPSAKDTPKNMVLFIDTTLAAYTALASSSQFEVSIYGHMGGADTSYKVTNIKFTTAPAP
jgi:hypothetical protein